MALEITNKTRKKLTPRETSLFKKAYKAALTEKIPDYELSLVICTDKISDHNVLAYPLSRDSGEIFINPSRSKPYSLIYLFIHACAHLLGHKHGKKMDLKEAEIRKKL